MSDVTGEPLVAPDMGATAATGFTASVARPPQARPPRILMTADTVGGVFTYAVELCRGLEAHGVHVVLATMGARLTRAQRATVSALTGVELCESDYRLEWMTEPWLDVDAAGDWLTRTRVIHNGRAPDALRIGPKEPLVLSAGRLWDEAKNLAALHACRALLPWPVYVAGPMHPPGSGPRSGPAHVRRTRLAGQAAERALRYTAERMTREYLDVYGELMRARYFESRVPVNNPVRM